MKQGYRRRLSKVFSRSGAGDDRPAPPQLIYIRAVSDTFHLSVDSSGELLFKRGVKSHPGRAPIRETLAAGVLIQAGYRKEVPLIDPMCGSGTFALEAAMMARSVPAGWYRKFAFMNWPAFRPGQWRQIRREATGNFRPGHGATIFAFDREDTAVRTLRTCIVTHGFDDTVHVERADFFSLSAQQVGENVGLVVLNPPYGRRMGAAGQKSEHYAAVCEKLTHDFRNWRFAIIAPPGAMPKGFAEIQSTHRLLHGGLRLMLYVGRIP